VLYRVSDSDWTIRVGRGIDIKIKLSSVLCVCILALSCSSPTDPSKHELIEQLIAELPLVMPIKTPENSTDDGLLLVAMKCDELLLAHHFALRPMLIQVLENGVHPERVESSWRWHCSAESSDDGIIVLTITPGDTLFFHIEWESAANAYNDGWVIPGTQEGRLFSFGGVREWSWGPNSFGYHLARSAPATDWSGTYTDMADSTNGGGYITEKEGIGLIFEGKWDESGHGSWWSKTLGSGSW